MHDDELVKLKPIWYLPHHAVWHPRKPEEPRVVFDCASKSGGTSLNEELLRGPENTRSLSGVILRFRVNEVAVTADIKRMFHQVHVTPEDRGALCYLWWPNGDLSREPKTYQMFVHIFGAKSSPSVAGYALRALLTRSENALLGNIFTSFCRNYDTKTTCKRSLSLIKPSFFESDVNISKFSAEFMAAAARKPQFYFLLDFSKTKTLRQVLFLFSKVVYQRVSPGKI